jgi:prepilin-type N-terminal cleavage/methylation domain-containing protein
MNNRRQRQQAFTLVEIMITIAIIGILIAIAVPGFIRSRHSARTKAIQQDLVKIDEASRIYIIENNLGPSDTMPDLDTLVTEGFLRSEPKPPVQGEYFAASLFTEVGTLDPDAYPRFEPSGGGGDPAWRHPDLIAGGL